MAALAESRRGAWLGAISEREAAARARYAAAIAELKAARVALAREYGLRFVGDLPTVTDFRVASGNLTIGDQARPFSAILEALRNEAAE